MRILIRGGTVYDGSGSAPFASDVLVEDGKIAQVGHGLPQEGTVVLNAAGLAVTPGFVDLHRHCDIAPFTCPEFGELELAQGITSTVVGNCGLAPLPMPPENDAEAVRFLEPIIGPLPPELRFASYGAYAGALEGAGLPLNMGFLAGLGAIKTAIKGFGDAPYTPPQLDRAADYVREAMEAGALGVSLGIMYPPELYSTTEEMAAAVRPAADRDGLLCAHIRGEGDSLTESVREVLHIADSAGLRLNISHFKSTGIHNWRDKIFRAIELIESARARGQAVTADFYPYEGGSSTLLSLLPPTLLADGNQAMLRELASPAGKARLRRELCRPHPSWDNMVAGIGWERILISSVTRPEHAGYSGKAIRVLAEELGYADPSDFVADLLVAEEGRVGIIVLSMAQQDVDHVARLPWTTLISDALYGGGECPHPRLYGAFPRFLREYVRERGVLPFEQAIHKMTGLPAARAGLRDRGMIRPGFRADIAVFSPERFADHATYPAPKQLATGMEYVLVNGALAWQNEARQGAPNGCLLTHQV